MAPNSQIDAQVRHAVYLERYKGGVAARILALLNRADADLVAQIQARDPNAVRGAWSAKRLELLLRETREINAAAHEEMGRELTAELKEFVEHETEWQAGALRSSVLAGVPVARPTMSQVRAAVFARPFQGRLLKEALAGVEAAKAARIRDAIRMGFVEGQPIEDIVRRIFGTRRNGYADGLLETDRRGVVALVRTAVAHTANVARQEAWGANADILQGWRFVATLDGRTTPACMALDGKIFPIGSGPQPPRHWGCRSTTIAVLKDEYAFLEDGATRAAREDGKVKWIDAGTNYGEWLKTQPAEFQDEVLGKERGKLFRKGGLKLDRFVDRSGRRYTLSELRARDKEAFAKIAA